MLLQRAWSRMANAFSAVASSPRPAGAAGSAAEDEPPAAGGDDGPDAAADGMHLLIERAPRAPRASAGAAAGAGGREERFRYWDRARLSKIQQACRQRGLWPGGHKTELRDRLLLFEFDPCKLSNGDVHGPQQPNLPSGTSEQLPPSSPRRKVCVLEPGGHTASVAIPIATC